MSPRPTLRATSTSRPSSIENIASPSTSLGAMAASSSAAEIAWHASDSSESGSPFAKDVWPMPAMAVRSASGRATTTSLPRRGSSARLPALELGRTPFDEARHALAGVLRRRHELLRVRLVPERPGAVGLERAVREPLREPDRPRRRLGEPTRPLAERLIELRPGHDLVHEPDALGLGGRDVVAEEEQLLRLLRADQASEQVRAAGVGRDAAADEHRDESRLLGHDHQVAGEREVHAAPRRRCIHARDDRLLAVLDRRDQPLPAVADDAGALTDDPLGGARRLRGEWGAARPDVGARAEALLALSGEDHRPNGRVAGR